MRRSHRCSRPPHLNPELNKPMERLDFPAKEWWEVFFCETGELRADGVATDAFFFCFKVDTVSTMKTTCFLYSSGKCFKFTLAESEFFLQSWAIVKTMVKSHQFVVFYGTKHLYRLDSSCPGLSLFFKDFSSAVWAYHTQFSHIDSYFFLTGHAFPAHCHSPHIFEFLSDFGDEHVRWLPLDEFFKREYHSVCFVEVFPAARIKDDTTA